MANNSEPSVHFTYLNEEAIESDLKCSICLDPFSDPRIHSSCGNMFCGGCISKLALCPLCREETGDSGSAPKAPLYVKNKIDSLKVVCTGCRRTFARSEFETHSKSCIKGTGYNCPIDPSILLK